MVLEFFRSHISTRHGQVKLALLCVFVFIISAAVGMAFFAQPYAVHATGEQVSDPWVVNVDGKPLLLVDSREAGESIEIGLRAYYAGRDFDKQQDLKLLNEITVTKYKFEDNKTHPVVMSPQEAVDYIVALNAEGNGAVIGFETQCYTESEEEIPYKTVQLEDDEFLVGETEVTQEGRNGRRQITMLQTLVNGEIVDAQIVAELVLEEPVNKVVVDGVMEPEPEPEPETTSGGGYYSASSGGGSGGHAISGGGLSTAYAMIGTPYVWGGTSTGGVDCSGLVNVCYGGARGRTTYNMIGSLQSTGDWKTSMSELNVGDLVFPHSGHVGIYIGDGMMIHAPSPGRTVCIAPVYSFYGGGAY